MILIPNKKVGLIVAQYVARALVLVGRDAEAQTFLDFQKQYWPSEESKLALPTLAEIEARETKHETALQNALAETQRRRAAAAEKKPQQP